MHADEHTYCAGMLRHATKKHFVGQHCIHNVRTCKSKSEIRDILKKTIAGDFGQ